MTRQVISVPPHAVVAATIDRNRARQFLVAEETASLLREHGEARARLEGGATFRVMKTARGLQTGEIALKMPRSCFDDPEKVPSAEELSWIGSAPASRPDDVRASYEDAFSFRRGSDDGAIPGLRIPQLGAVHAVLGYWTTGSTEPATVVMPTGTGKTETMLALLAAARPSRLMVVVPSDALRTQIAGKFETLGVLQAAGVISRTALRPVVGQVHHRFTAAEAAESFAELCNVIVTTPKALMASDDTVRAALLAACSHLFVDEAHHVEARTWHQIRDAFEGRPVLQFTATPYREDGRPLAGRQIYRFPLREAQRRGYFSQIDYTSVVDFADPDGELARRAVARLRDDIQQGLDHVLMARVNRISRAHELRDLYAEIAPEHRPVVLDSSLAKRDRTAALAALFARESRIVVCVDMLGEGFDLPALKVAAIHDPHKSLGVTLQYVGRFARVAGATIGRASVFVGRPERDYDHRLRRLYAEDADWNAIISDLSERASEEEHEIGEFEGAFAFPPEDLPMRSLTPKMSTVVYRTVCADWNPDGVVNVFPEDTLLTWPLPVNLERRVLWFVSELRSPIAWAELPTVEEISHHLYVAYWDLSRQLLYINSSDKTSHHEGLAKALAGEDVSLIRGMGVYRAMSGLQRLVPTNVGLLDVRNKNRRFQMLVGANVREGFPTAEAQTKTQTNIFASGFEDGRRATIGASLKGRVWSYQQARSIKHWVDWCDHVGAKLADETIDIDEVMGSFIKPRELSERPPLVAIGIEWPTEFWLSTSEDLRATANGSSSALLDAELRITDFSTVGPFRFEVRTPDWAAPYEAHVEGEQLVFRAIGPEVILERPRAASAPLSTYFDKNGPLILLEGEAMIVPPAILLQPDSSRPPFDPEKLEILEWGETNLRRESQGVERDPTSIQARAVEHVLSIADWDVVLDDDGTGEVADIVALRIDGPDLRALLVHCKYSSEDFAGGRVEDLYDVCGQAQKSIRWKHYVDDMFARLIKREQRRVQRDHYSGFHVGSGNELYRMRDDAYRLRPAFTIAIAQPGLSRQSVSREQLHLLASTEVYVNEVAVADFTVWCSR